MVYFLMANKVVCVSTVTAQNMNDEVLTAAAVMQS